MTIPARLWIALALALTAVVAFWPVREQPFLDYDDDVYVVENPVVNGGLRAEAIGEALSGFHAANWHPLTWVSHQVDVELFGLEPRGHHTTSLAWHGLNAALLFLWLDAAVGPARRRRSAFVAAIFAVHPLAIDSVAWVAERKNLLATGFTFAGLWLWVEAVRSEGPARRPWHRVGAVALFGLAMMSKPAAVVAPGLLLALDVWPLERWSRETWMARVLEKWPVFVLSAGLAVLTIAAQGAGGAVEGLTSFPPAVRAANALVSLPTYLGLLVWPAWPNALAILHPHPADAIAPARVVLAFAVVVALGVAVARAGRSRRYLWAGAAWGAIGLLPVIGLVQVGVQSHAERYAYLPMVGPLFAVVWAAGDLARARAWPRQAVGAMAVLVLLTLGFVTRSELRYWRDEVTLFTRAVEVHDRTGVATPHAMILHYQLGTALQEEGRVDEAERSYRRAIDANPVDPRPHNNLGTMLVAQGRNDEAAEAFARALDVRPDHPSALFNLALHEAQRGDPARGRALFVRYLERGVYNRSSRDAAIHGLIALDAPEVAAAAALAAVPRDAPSLALASEALLAAGRDAAARDALEAALALAPADRIVRNNLADLLATSDVPEVRDGARALAIMRELEREAPLDEAERDTLAAARAAAAGR